MRVVHVAPFYIPVVGGVEEVARRIAEHLARKGIDIYVVTYNRSRSGKTGILPRSEVINGVKVIRVEPNVTWSHGSYSDELPSVIAKLRPDVVHVHVWRHPHVFQISKMRKRYNFKTVLHSHAPFHIFSQVDPITWLYHKAVDSVARRVLCSYDIIIALTPHEKKQLIQKFQCPEEKIYVIPNGTEGAVNPSSSSKAVHPPILLYIGRVSKQKNVTLLVKAFYHLKKFGINARLVIAGPDEGQVKKLKALARRFNGAWGSEIVYLGPVSETLKKLLLARSTLFLHPALYEPFGITLLEAQAYGKPCVITGEGGQLYVAPPNVSSLHADSSPAEYAKAIKRLLTDDELYSRLSKNAVKWASLHTWDRILPKYERIYET